MEKAWVPIVADGLKALETAAGCDGPTSALVFAQPPPVEPLVKPLIKLFVEHPGTIGALEIRAITLSEQISTDRVV